MEMPPIAMPPGDCETQTVAEVEANVGAVAAKTGQVALLDLAASRGTCKAADSSRARRETPTKDTFAVGLAFKATVSSDQIASAVESTGAAIAAGLSVSLAVDGEVKTVDVPTDATITLGTTAAAATRRGSSFWGDMILLAKL